MTVRQTFDEVIRGMDEEVQQGAIRGLAEDETFIAFSDFALAFKVAECRALLTGNRQQINFSPLTGKWEITPR